MRSKLLLTGLLVLFVLVILGKNGVVKRFFVSTLVSDRKLKPITTAPGNKPSPTVPKITIIAEGLKIPWEIVFLPDGDILVTERPGTIKRIGGNTNTYQIEGVYQLGEGGLLGMALHPRFAENNFIYLYLTSKNDRGPVNRVLRYVYVNNTFTDRTVILDNLQAASNHNGGRIAFGPDQMLYITVGDAQNGKNAQNKNLLAGKILRVSDDGKTPSDNPFGNEVYSYGHRNPQGITWDSAGKLWATEHGRSGILSGFDEINLIEKGKNYGWPVIQGPESQKGMETSIANSGASTTWAPAGITYHHGSLFFAGLRGEALYKAVVNDDRSAFITELFKHQFGRIRVVVTGPDGSLYIATSNTDGRGKAKLGDDKIIRIDPKIIPQ